MPDRQFDADTAIYTPQEVAAYGMEAVRGIKNKEDRGLRFPVVGIDTYFAPVLPGQLCVIQAQTSHYKSGFMHFWEHVGATQLNDQERYGEMIVHVSVEECVEEQAFFEFARYSQEDPGKLSRGDVQDWSRLEHAAVQVGKIPIYRIGDSLARADDMPELYLTNILRSIKRLMEREQRKPAAIFVDYLQALPIDPEIRQAMIKDQRRLQVRQDVYRLRQAAVQFDCPIILAAQAKQNMTGANPPLMIPGVYDAEETSAVGQRADRIISLWMPKNTYPVGKLIESGKIVFTVAEHQLWIKVNKQRGGLPAGKLFPCRVDFRTNTVVRELVTP